MQYTKIITLTGSGVSGSVRIEGSGGRTHCSVSLRQPSAKRLVLFLLSREHVDTIELSDKLKGTFDSIMEADAALLAENDNGVLRFIAQGKSLGCKTDLEKIKQDIRLRQIPIGTKSMPVSQKHSLKSLAEEYKKPVPEQYQEPFQDSAAEFKKEVPQQVRAIPMPVESSPEETLLESDALSEPAPGEPDTGKPSRLTSVRLPVRRKKSILEMRSRRLQAGEDGAGSESEAAAETEQKRPEELSDVVDKTLREAAEDPPMELKNSKALSEILAQARELFPSGYDRPNVPGETSHEDIANKDAKGKQKGKIAKHLTPMQKNAKWDGEMEDVLNAPPDREQGMREEPVKTQDAAKQTAKPLNKAEDFTVPNPFPETFPKSKWRKVTYPGTNRFFLEGEAVGANGVFQIAALPGEYSAVPPQRAKGFNRFIRASDGCGYWLRFYKK